MDSSNSGSFQSSSGGAGDNNDEYDSRTQSISSFFNHSTNFNPNLNQLLQPQQQPPPPPSYHPSPTFYNTLPVDPWTTTGSTTIPQQDFTTYQQGNVSLDPHTKTGRGSDHQIGVSIKNPKKRTRASRRAPTTVLTTDTTNFRQMVQEFTGIPTAPFTTAPFSRRLDLFTGGSGSLHPLRPSAQKIQPQPPPFLNSNSNNNAGNYNFTPSTMTELQKQPSSFLDLQNPMFSFQSLLQNTNIPQQSDDLQKRWREQKEGGSNVLVSSRNGSGSGDQVQGNEAGSWIS